MIFNIPAIHSLSPKSFGERVGVRGHHDPVTDKIAS